MISRLVIRLQALDLRFLIAARLLQVLGRVVQFVLIEFHLRFDHIDLVLQIVFLRFRSKRELTREFRKLVLIFLDCLLRLFLADLDHATRQ